MLRIRGFPANNAVKSTIEICVYGDITGRLGYAFDRTLLREGWLRLLQGNARITDAGDVSPKSQSFTGWTLGGGIEYKMSPAWSLKAEYLHYDLGSEPVTLANSGARYETPSRSTRSRPA